MLLRDFKFHNPFGISRYRFIENADGVCKAFEFLIDHKFPDQKSSEVVE